MLVSKKLLLVLFLLGALSALSFIGLKLKNAHRGAEVYALGDSLTFGAGSGGFNYVDRISDLTGLKVINKGISGDTTEMMLKRTNFPDASKVIVWGG